jgi:hypothetical protein
MCTVSVVPPYGDRGWRLMVNRDERRTRPAAWPPLTNRVGTTTMVSPIDSHALGTWIAATNHGLAFAVMNASPAPLLLPRAETMSRGTVIPAVAGVGEPAEATRLLTGLPLTSIAPFRLVVTNGDEIAWGSWDGRALESAVEPLLQPRLYASSGLGDHLVARAREELFEHLLGQERDPWRAQDRLHVHAWPDRRHLSVNMTRVDACTVSRTTVVGRDAAMEMTYVPYLDGWPGPAANRVLTCRQRALASVA